MDEAGFFDVVHNTRSMRRFKSDPVPMELLWQVLDAGIKAPSGQNTQPWTFLLVRETEGKQFIGSRYLSVFNESFGDRRPATEDNSAAARGMRAAIQLAENMHEVPALLLVCGVRDWPFAVAKEHRVGKAPPSYGSVYPCVQNILLACRAVGLGATLTTMHQLFEDELHAHFGIPDDHGVVALIPIGYPQGKFGPVRRQPVAEVTCLEHWSRRQG